jgi:biopolymer transport protein TolR
MAIRRRGSRRKRPVSDMNVVPYIDVMFVLLIIFMVTAPLVQQGVEIDLPIAAAETIDTSEVEPIIIDVNEWGGYFLSMSNEPYEETSTAELLVKVRAMLQFQPNVSVMVRGDRAVPYHHVVQLMVMLKEAGVEKVGLMTQPPEDQG